MANRGMGGRPPTGDVEGHPIGLKTLAVRQLLSALQDAFQEPSGLKAYRNLSFGGQRLQTAVQRVGNCYRSPFPPRFPRGASCGLLLRGRAIAHVMSITTTRHKSSLDPGDEPGAAMQATARADLVGVASREFHTVRIVRGLPLLPLPVAYQRSKVILLPVESLGVGTVGHETYRSLALTSPNRNSPTALSASAA